MFQEFTPPTYDDWRDLVIAELDGGDFDKKLVWRSREGFEVQPLYTGAQTAHLPHLDVLPGSAPFVRGTTALENLAHPWRNTTQITTPDPDAAAREVAEAIEGGATGVGFRMDDAGRLGICAARTNHGMAECRNGVAIQTLDDTSAILTHAFDAHLPVHVDAGWSAPVLLAHSAILSGHRGAMLCGAVLMDPVALLVECGALPAARRDVFATLAAMVRFQRRNECPLRVVGASAEPWHNAGATLVQELGFTLATGAAYMQRLTEAGIAADDAARAIRFTFPVGTNFFFEIARLRAARMLWAKIARAFGATSDEACAMDIHVRTSWRQQTAYDPYVNMLRATVESMAGALGGARSMHTAPFNEALGAATPFSSRIARNTQTVLREESHIGRVVDPAGGSHYVEHLTDRIGREAWSLFQKVDAEGGMLRALETGLVHALISEAAAAAREATSRRRDVLIGTNQYPNLTEHRAEFTPADSAAARTAMTARLAAHRAARVEADVVRTLDAVARTSGEGADGLVEALMAATAAGATRDELLRALYPIESATDVEVRALRAERAAEPFERIRNAVMAREPRPTVFLATLGGAVWRRARAGFASGFLGAGGFAITDNNGFDTAEAAAAAAIDAKADIVVVCSDDDSYPTVAPVVAGAVKQALPDAIVLVAGNPADADALRAAGVDDFIHMRSDCGATLAALAARLGIDIAAKEVTR